MRRNFNPLPLAAFLVLALISPQLHADSGPRAKRAVRSHAHKSIPLPHPVAFSAAFEEEALSLYDQIGLEQYGLSKKAFEYAYKGYLYLQQHSLLSREGILSICDFSQSSNNKRMYVLDLDQKRILVNTYVAHGRNSGAEFASSFSNSNRSHKSSLGFYLTQNTYFGDHGLSLKLSGLERGFNDQAARRAIVVHGSDYVGEDFLGGNSYTGRSFGCPAVPSSESDAIIETIKEGTCLFIYHPTQRYIALSKILNN